MNYLNSFIGILLLLFLWGCSDEATESSEWRDEAGVVPTTFVMGTAVSEMPVSASRSKVEKWASEAYPPLWVVVFDGAGYLVEYARADHLVRQGDEITFEVILRATSEKRIVHFLWGYADRLQLRFGHESTVMGNLSVSGDQIVCWGRRVLEQGLDEAQVAAHLRRVPLVRNYAKITVRNHAARDFKMLGFYVLNVPSSGSVAPRQGGKFVDYWSGSGLQAKDYVELVEREGYLGALPSDMHYLHRPGGEDQNLEWVPETDSYLLYEHRHTDDAATTLSVMLKGHYRGGAIGYYKVDLVRQEAERAVYFHILRNFEYLLNINEVVGEGETNFREATFGLSGNNLSSSVIVRKVLNISDGKSAFRVAYTDTTLVSTHPVKLRFRYVPDISSPDVTDNRRVGAKWLESPDGHYFSPDIRFAEETGGWASFTLTPQRMPAYPVAQQLLIYSRDNALSRQINVELRPALSLEVRCTPKQIAEKRGESVWAEVLLPDQLSETLFPLHILFEAQEKNNTDYLHNTLSPHADEVMSVRSGPSVVPGFERHPAIQYEKSLTHAQYQSLPRATDGVRHLLRCHFVTNTRRSAATVYAYNKYFVKASDTFGYGE